MKSSRIKSNIRLFPLSTIIFKRTSTFQVAVAAMDVHRDDVVDETLAELRKAFDVDSFRVRRLMVSD